MNKYEKIYTNLKDIFSSINFNALEDGFTQYNFALYNQEKVYFDGYSIDHDNRFLGSTAIEYENEYIAIFYLDNPKNINLDILAKDIIHEMYHAHQFTKGVTVFPDDFVGLDYPLEINYLSQKYNEVNILKELFSANEFYNETKIKDIEESISIRQKQYSHIREFEVLIEDLEGTAEYIGLKSLAQMNLTIFNQVVENYILALTEDFEILLNPRKYHLIFGALFNIVSDDKLFEDIDVKRKEENNFSESTILNKIENAITVKQDILKDKINLAYEKSIDLIEGNFRIIGYDPMNMFKLDDKIICETFVVLKDLDQGTNLNLNGPVILEDLSNDNRHTNKVYISN